MDKVAKFVIQVEDGGKTKYVCFYPSAHTQSGMPEPMITSYIELAYHRSSYFDIKMFEAFCKGTRNFVNGCKPKIKAYLLPNENFSVDYLMHRGVINYENIGFSDILSEEQKSKIDAKYEETYQNYKHIKRFGDMEEIKDKAFDDELNKAEERVENERVDKTPLPPHREKKSNKENEQEDGEK